MDAKKLILLADSMLQMIREKDASLHRHSVRVGCLSYLLSSAVGLDERMCSLALLAGRVHDIGKIAIPESVLYKKGALVDSELKVIENHPVFGAKYLMAGFDKRANHIDNGIRELMRHYRSKDQPHHTAEGEMTITAVLFHHEKYDGTGYPCRLEEDRIPVLASIVCLADYYVAMREKRPYRDEYVHDTVIRTVKGYSGRMFKPEMVEKLRGLLNAYRRYQISGIVSGRDKTGDQFTGQARDISLSGMFIQCDRSLKKGSLLNISFKIDGKCITVPASIARVNSLGFGICFRSNNGSQNDEQVSSLKSLIKNISAGKDAEDRLYSVFK